MSRCIFNYIFYESFFFIITRIPLYLKLIFSCYFKKSNMFTRSKGKISDTEYRNLLGRDKKNNINKKENSQNTPDNDADEEDFLNECFDYVLGSLKGGNDVAIVTSAMEKILQELKIKDINLEKIKMLRTRQKKQNSYDKYDKKYITYVYGSISDYDSDIEGEKDIKYCDDDDIVRYFRLLDENAKKRFVEKIDEIHKKCIKQMPVLLQILDSNLDPFIKIKARKMHERHNPKCKEWAKRLLTIPFGEYATLHLNKKSNTKREISKYLLTSHSTLNEVVYGHKQAKNQIIQIISNMICNPHTTGHVFGIQGPPGNGKTTLLKNGLSKVMGRPFEMIQLGGMSDSSYLVGHSFTYDGSQYGRIVQCLIHSECMNPIIYFDELDKVSKTDKGKEITGILTHLTDPSQNMYFQDKYFSGVNIDVSKAIIVFSFNDIKKIDRILLDRIRVINTKGFGSKDKIQIAHKFLLPDIYKNINFDSNNLVWNHDVLQYVILHYTKEEGVRELKRCLDTIITRINMLSLIDEKDYKTIDISFKIKPFRFPLRLSIDMINILLEKPKQNDPPLSMYM